VSPRIRPLILARALPEISEPWDEGDEALRLKIAAWVKERRVTHTTRPMTAFRNTPDRTTRQTGGSRLNRRFADARDM
jgi:hypothetical protein